MYNLIIIEYLHNVALFPSIKMGNKAAVWKQYEYFINLAIDKGYEVYGNINDGDVELYNGDILTYRVAIEAVHKL